MRNFTVCNEVTRKLGESRLVEFTTEVGQKRADLVFLKTLFSYKSKTFKWSINVFNFYDIWFHTLEQSLYHIEFRSKGWNSFCLVRRTLPCTLKIETLKTQHHFRINANRLLTQYLYFFDHPLKNWHSWKSLLVIRTGKSEFSKLNSRFTQFLLLAEEYPKF